jgi:hypothetical protein
MDDQRIDRESGGVKPSSASTGQAIALGVFTVFWFVFMPLGMAILLVPLILWLGYVLWRDFKKA